jgi:hypothetical protein
MKREMKKNQRKMKENDQLTRKHKAKRNEPRQSEVK